MLKALLIGVAIAVSAAPHSAAASNSTAVKTEVALTHGRQDVDAKKKAWFEREVTKILEGRTAPLDADR